MTISLIEAKDIRPGDLMECTGKVWRPVRSIQALDEWLYFRFDRTVDTRMAIPGDLVMVGRQEER